MESARTTIRALRAEWGKASNPPLRVACLQFGENLCLWRESYALPLLFTLQLSRLFSIHCNKVCVFFFFCLDSCLISGSIHTNQLVSLLSLTRAQLCCEGAKSSQHEHNLSARELSRDERLCLSTSWCVFEPLPTTVS